MKKAVFILLLFVAVAGNASAQGCSVCTKTAQELDSKSAKGLNGGIVYLAFLPLIFMGTVGLIWWRSNRNA